jgi:predicted N-acetyltransferase YhbS
MTDAEIRGMTLNDLGLCMSLFGMVGWGNTEDDVRRMLHYEPDGCFIASLGGVDVGMVASIRYGLVGWVGNLIVQPEHRGKGIGTSLMKAAMRYLKEAGASSIRLDSVSKAVPLYRRLGFREEFASLRFTGEGKRFPVHPVDAMMPSDLDEVVELDGWFFGAPRGRVLRRVYEDFPELCFVKREESRISGFIMAKEGEGTFRIGPWIYQPGDPGSAEVLLERLMTEFEGEVLWVGVPEGNGESVKMLDGHGFGRIPTSTRMCHGLCGPMGVVEGRFGIGGPDKG